MLLLRTELPTDASDGELTRLSGNVSPRHAKCVKGGSKRYLFKVNTNDSVMANSPVTYVDCVTISVFSSAPTAVQNLNLKSQPRAHHGNFDTPTLMSLLFVIPDRRRPNHIPIMMKR
jgi:hypothetical protein